MDEFYIGVRSRVSVKNFASRLKVALRNWRINEGIWFDLIIPHVRVEKGYEVQKDKRERFLFVCITGISFPEDPPKQRRLGDTLLELLRPVAHLTKKELVPAEDYYWPLTPEQVDSMAADELIPLR